MLGIKLKCRNIEKFLCFKKNLKKIKETWNIFKVSEVSLLVEMKDRIIIAGFETFFKYGIRSVTLDQIASELGISKKTIYQHFKDKDELVFTVAAYAIDNERKDALCIFSTADNPIHEMVLGLNVMMEFLNNINPIFLFDLEKYYPRAWSLYLKSKKEYRRDVVRNLTLGVKEGLYRADINIEILSAMRIESFELAFDQEVFPQKDFKMMDIQIQFLDHFLRGVLTQKGLELYEDLLGNQGVNIVKQVFNK